MTTNEETSVTEPATTEAVYPMTPQEAAQFARLLEQRAQIDRALEDVASRAKARLGLAHDARATADMDACVYRVGG